MIRRPVTDCFDPKLLRLWLEQSDENVKTKPRYINDISTLIHLGRFRLLEVNSGNVIIVTHTTPYLTLSYVWGQCSLDKSPAHDSNPADREGVAWKVDIERLPQTVRDAVRLTQSIGEDFLWIDSICIDQSDGADKAANISAMGSIYAGGLVTIVAANGNDANAGLSRMTTTSMEPQLEFAQGDQTLRFLEARPSLETLLKRSKWNTRGWTYQEHLLSKRCVFFTEAEVLFTHGGLIHREAYELIARNPPLLGTTVRTGKRISIFDISSRSTHTSSWSIVAKHYAHTVEAYAARDLSHKGDRLLAFAGILRLFSGFWVGTNLGPLSGLVAITNIGSGTSRFLEWLLWQPIGTSVTRIQRDVTGLRALPSWSWTGRTGGIEFPFKDMGLRPIALNETNIYCIYEIPGVEQWPYKPEPCETCISTGIVLHLWIPVVRRMLRPCECSMESSSSELQPMAYEIVSHREVRPVVPASLLSPDLIWISPNEFTPDVNELYNFLVLPGWHRSSRTTYQHSCLLMLVRCRGAYVERVALSDGVSRRSVDDAFPSSYKHVMLI